LLTFDGRGELLQLCTMPYQSVVIVVAAAINWHDMVQRLPNKAQVEQK